MKIICIGRNYANHAKELNNPIPKQPLVFMKPPTAVLKVGNELYYPEFTKDLHYELEVVLKICKNGKHIQKKYASNYYEEIGLGIDFTARDIQKKCKEKGHPWEIAKSFDNSVVLGSFCHKSELDVGSIKFELLKNGSRVQFGDTKDLIFSFDTLISYVSQFFTLQKGDYLFTGTPEGVGPVEIGDELEGLLENKSILRCYIK